MLQHFFNTYATTLFAFPIVIVIACLTGFLAGMGFVLLRIERFQRMIAQTYHRQVSRHLFIMIYVGLLFEGIGLFLFIGYLVEIVRLKSTLLGREAITFVVISVIFVLCLGVVTNRRMRKMEKALQIDGLVHTSRSHIPKNVHEE